MELNFCARCGHALEKRKVDDRVRRQLTDPNADLTTLAPSPARAAA